MKRALLIAFHFPPFGFSSGIQRTLKFAIHLREHGWQPMVLSADPRAYPKTGHDQMGDIPADVPVRRAFALDTARHLSIAGRYPRWLAMPDRYISWLPAGVWQGMAMVRQYQPELIWSTFPIPTALRIGYWLHRLSGLPWVADFRDSMMDEGYPADPALRRRVARIEAQTVTRCSRAVFTTPGTRDMYAARYAELPADRWALIPNGYDEETFSDAASLGSDAPLGAPGQKVLVHAGLLYPNERDPRPFFQALAALKAAGDIDAARLKVMLRATGHDEHYAPLLKELGIDDLVELAPAIPYREALNEMLRADGLLLFQATNCNHQIPAKLYEYLRAGRPILALTDPLGDTATTLREAGAGLIVRLDNADDIRQGLGLFLTQVEQGSAALIPPDRVGDYARAAGAQRLATLFDEVMAEQQQRTQG